MPYEIWVASLNSLRNDTVVVPTKEEEVDNYIIARERRDFHQTHDQAAWIQQDGEIIA